MQLFYPMIPLNSSLLPISVQGNHQPATLWKCKCTPGKVFLFLGDYSVSWIFVIGRRETQRPDWLAARLRTMSIDENGPRFYVLRQPKGPDGTRGFKIAPRSSMSSNGVSAAKANGDSEALGNAWMTSNRISSIFRIFSILYHSLITSSLNK